MPSRLLRALLAALLVVAMSAGTPIAAAHTVLTSSEPAADAVVPTGPGRVTATFNEDLQPMFAAMTVVGPDGNLWSAGEPEVRGRTVGVNLRTLGPAGSYTVNYRVTSADGHVVAGSWSFTVTTSSTGTPGPQATTDTQRDPIPLWPFAVGAVTLVAAAAVWALRRRS